jgi:hypothetical protein
LDGDDPVRAAIDDGGAGFDFDGGGDEVEEADRAEVTALLAGRGGRGEVLRVGVEAGVAEPCMGLGQLVEAGYGPLDLGEEVAEGGACEVIVAGGVVEAVQGARGFEEVRLGLGEALEEADGGSFVGGDAAEGVGDEG